MKPPKRRAGVLALTRRRARQYQDDLEECARHTRQRTIDDLRHCSRALGRDSSPRNAAVRAALAVLGADSPIATQAGASVAAIEVAGTDEEEYR